MNAENHVVVRHREMVKELAKPGQAIKEQFTGNGITLVQLASDLNHACAGLLLVAAQFIHKNNPANFFHCLHMAIGMAGESGEILDKVKKYAFYGKELPIEGEGGMIEEMGDMEFFWVGSEEHPLSIQDHSRHDWLHRIRRCMADMYFALNLDRNKILEANIQKLRDGKNARHKNGFSDASQTGRADKHEMLIKELALLSPGLAAIAKERIRQLTDIGYTIESDAKRYKNGELATAAGNYILSARGQLSSKCVPITWPWEDEFWRPSTPTRDTEKAAALLCAHWDVLDWAERGGAQLTDDIFGADTATGVAPWIVNPENEDMKDKAWKTIFNALRAGKVPRAKIMACLPTWFLQQVAVNIGATEAFKDRAVTTDDIVENLLRECECTRDIDSSCCPDEDEMSEEEHSRKFPKRNPGDGQP